MPDHHRACPGASELEDFHAGRLAGLMARRVADHTQACRACRAALTEFSLDDSLAHELRELFPGGPAPGSAIDRQPPRIQGIEVVEELGHGGMGVVWKGRDAELGRVVAVKVLHEKLASDAAAQRRFVVEARITGQLQHPGIVPVYRLGATADRRPFLSMKLVKGRTLSKILSDGETSGASPLEHLAIFHRICEAVAYAHSRGVIHRDLKPGNVMVGSFGEVQVLDWGLAKVLTEEDSDADASVITPLSPDSPTGHESIAGRVMGTPSYMSPEQAAGRLESVSQRSDVFSLGAILCEILTGRRPRSRESGDLERQLRECGADSELVELTRACLSPGPAERPEDAAQVAQATSSYLTAVQERTRKAELEAAAARAGAAQERKARRRTALLASALLVAVLAASLAFRQTWRNQTLAAEGTATTLANARALFEKGDFEGAAMAADSVLDQADQLGGSKGNELQLLARNARLMSRLIEHRPQGALFVINRATQSLIHTEYRRAFTEHGIDVLESNTAEAAAHLEHAGIGPLVRPLLDAWTRTAFYNDGSNSADARQLIALASALDADATREELRDVLRETQDREELETFLDAEHALHLDPSTFTLLIESLWMLPGGGNPQDGSATHRAAWVVHERYPQDVDVLMILAETSFTLADTERRGEGEPLTLAARAFLHETIEHLSGVCALDPGGAIPWARLGHVYTFLGDRQRSDAAYSAAVQRMDRTTPAKNRELSCTMYEWGATEPVIERLEAMVAEYPDEPSLWSELAWSLYSTTPPRDTPRALDAARRAVELDPVLYTYREVLATALYHAGEFRECVDTLDRLVEDQPGSPYWGLMKAICLHELGYEEEAARLGRRMLRRMESAWGDYISALADRGVELFGR